MRQIGRLMLGMVTILALAAGSAARAASEEPPAYGVGPAYEALGQLAVMHAGRVKPIDTLAREEVKQIFGRETIKLHDDENKVVATWGPVGRPLRLVGPAQVLGRPADHPGRVPSAQAPDPGRTQVREDLASVLDRSTMSAEDKEAIRKLLIAARALVRRARPVPGRIEPRQDRGRPQARQDAGGQASRRTQVAHARRAPGAPRSRSRAGSQSFMRWVGEIDQRNKEMAEDITSKAKLPEIEKRAMEVGTRLVHYQAFRDRSVQMIEPLLALPHPNNTTFLAFIAAAVKKAQATGDASGMSPLELDGLKALDTYWKELPRTERRRARSRPQV